MVLGASHAAEVAPITFVYLMGDGTTTHRDFQLLVIHSQIWVIYRIVFLISNIFSSLVDWDVHGKLLKGSTANG